MKKPRFPQKHLIDAMTRWSLQPAKARQDIIEFFRDEAKASDLWARDPGMGEQARHRQDARTIRAAIALLRAAQ